MNNISRNFASLLVCLVSLAPAQLTFDPDHPPAQLTPPTETYHHFASHVKGPKTMMVMAVLPTDAPAWDNPPTYDSLIAGLRSSSQRFYTSSYHQTWFGPKRLNGRDIPKLVVTPVLPLPRTMAEYIGNFGLLQSDSLAAVRAQGGEWNGGRLDPNNFDRWVPMSSQRLVGSTGLAYVGGRFAWVGGTLSSGVALHEWGHNWGLWHANAWNVPEGEHPRSPLGSNGEYADGWCIMGGNATGVMFNPMFRRQLHFLEENRGEVVAVTQSGTHRIYNYVHADRRQPESLVRALRIPMESWGFNGEIILGFGHTSGTDGGWSRADYNRNAVTVHARLSNGSNRIDTTPHSRQGNDDRNDSSIKIGRTYSEPAGLNNNPDGFHITPVLRGSTEVNGQTHEWIEVVIHYDAQTGANQPPTASFGTTMIEGVEPGVPYELTVTASDPDGDPLAFDWDFGDDTYNLVNSPTQTKTWTEAGLYLVSVTVSDMKGGTAVAQTWVNVGGVEFRYPEDPPATVTGLNYTYYHGVFNQLPDMGQLFPVKTGTASTPGIGPREQNNQYVFLYEGHIEVPANDVYSFHLRSKDGSRLYIGDTLVVDNNGLKSIPLEVTGNIALNAGKHAIRLEMFNMNGGGALSLEWSTLSMSRAPVPAANFHRPDWSGIAGPEAALTSPLPGSTHTMGEDIPVTASVTSGADITRVAYFSNEVYIGEALSAPWTFAWPDAYGGTRELRALVFDANGRKALSDPVTIQVEFPADGADTISVNFVHTNPVYDFPAAETAGVMPRANWNHISGMTAFNLVDNDGNITNVSYSTTSRYMYARNTPSGTSADHRMMSTHRGDTGSTTTFTFSDIPFATYDVYVYWGAQYRDELFPDYLRLTLGNEVVWLRADSQTWSGEFIESTAGTRAEATGPANYAVFRNLSGGSFTFEAFADTANDQNRAAPAGIQIVRSDALPPPPPPPAAPANLLVTHATHYEVVMIWMDNADDETGYRVYRAPSGEGPWTQVADLPPDSDAYTDGTVQGNTLYFYQVRAWNDNGESLPSNTVSVTTPPPPSPPMITGHPLSQTVTEGQDVTFSVSAVGNPAPEFQWRKDGQDIPGATSATLTLNNVPMSAAGAYDVVAVNMYGSMVSQTATLIVTESNVDSEQFLINFGTANYTTDGIRDWQTINLQNQSVSNLLLKNSEGDSSSGIQISVSSTVTGDVGTNSPGPTLFEENPFIWFDPTESAQTEVFSFNQQGATWTYTFSGFDPADEVTFEMVIRRLNANRNITLVFNPGEADEDILLNNADSGITRYVSKTASGSTTYQLVLTGEVSSWVATINAMAVTVVRESAPPPVTPATVTFGNLTQTVDGTPKSPAVMTDPPGLSYSLTFDGSDEAPATSGTYDVVAAVTEEGYEGSATATFTLLTDEGIVDSSGSGADDGWELEIFGNLDNEPVVIAGREYTRRQVYVWGLPNPTESVFKLENMSFSTVSDRWYQIQYRASLTEDDWENHGGPFRGGGENGSVTIEPGPGFYRVRVMLGPPPL
jgi:hypothetical protein